MNNIQKAFKNKAKCGLRLAVGGVVMADEQPVQQVAQPVQQVAQPIISTGSSDLDTLGTSAGSAPKFALKSMAETSAGNQPYKAGQIGDPKASGLPIAPQRSGGQGASARPAPVQPVQSDMSTSSGLTALKQNGLRKPAVNLADGGVVETPEQLMARMAQKYGTSGAVQTVERPVQQPAPQPAPAPVKKPDSGGLIGGALKAIGLRRQAMDNLADGGVVKVHGPGTGTSDDIPLTLKKGAKGVDVNVSNGEALAVLPAKTAENPDAIDAVNDIIYQTNGKPPKGLRAGGSYEAGLAPYLVEGEYIPANNTPNVPANVSARPALAAPQASTAVTPASPVYEPAQPTASVGEATRSKIPVQDGVRTAAEPAKPNFTQPRNMPTQYSPPTTEPVPASQNGRRFTMPEIKAPGLRAGLKALGGAAAATGAGVQGFSTGSDLNEVWGNDKTDTLSKAGATLEGVGNVAGNILSFGMLQDPVTAGGRMISKLIGGDGTTAMDRALVGTSRDRTSQQPQNVAQPVAPSGNDGYVDKAPEDWVSGKQDQLSSTGELATGGAPIRGLRIGRDELTNAPTARFNSNYNAASRSVEGLRNGDGVVPDGFGVASMRQKDGTFKNIVTGRSEYVGADGKPTNKWTDTQAYRDAIAQNEKDKASLREIQRQNAKSDLASSHEYYKARGRDTLNALAQEQASDTASRQADAMIGLRKSMIDMQGRQLDQSDRHFNAQLKAASIAAGKKEADDRLNNLTGLFDGVNLPEDQRKDFKMKVMAGHVGGIQNPDGTFTSTVGDLEKMSKPQQAKQMQALLGEYLRSKSAFDKRLNAGSAGPFQYDHEDTLGAQDIAEDPNAWFWNQKITSDDPNEMTVTNFLNRKLNPLGPSDAVAVGKNGMRVLKNDVVKNYFDANGNLVSGKADERLGLRRAHDAKKTGVN